MKSFIVAFFVSLLYSSLTAGAAISSSPATGIILPNNTSLADDGDTLHCSRDFDSYGRFPRGSVGCILALYELTHSPRFSHLPTIYPMDFISSTTPLPAGGNGFKTPWRSTFGESTIPGQHSYYRVTELLGNRGLHGGCCLAQRRPRTLHARSGPRPVWPERGRLRRQSAADGYQFGELFRSCVWH